jgi:phospholipid-binding lipoprotein MlaA
VTRLQGWAARITVALFVSTATVRAQPSVPSDPEPSFLPDLLERYSRSVFHFNRLFYQGMGRILGWLDAPESGILATAGSGVANAVGNLVKEPITAVSSLLVGDLPTAGLAVRRLAINSTAGYLGVRDRASEWGYTERPADLGLSLCRLGVGEGGYIVLPFIGPRTIRDGLSDIVLTNAILWPLVGAVTGGGASLQTILIAEGIEVAADIVGTRQIDPVARDISMEDYVKMRANYLAQRRQRCGGESLPDRSIYDVDTSARIEPGGSPDGRLISD